MREKVRVGSMLHQLQYWMRFPAYTGQSSMSFGLVHGLLGRGTGRYSGHMRLPSWSALDGRFAALAMALMLTSAADGSAQARASSLVGTWRFIEITDFDSTGAPVQYYGEKPCGFIVYTATGQVSVQIARCPSPEQAPTELAATYNGYFGTYTVNEAKGLVTHLVEGGSAPDYIGTPQQRAFRIKGDTLVLGDGQSYKRVLVRVR